MDPDLNHKLVFINLTQNNLKVLVTPKEIPLSSLNKEQKDSEKSIDKNLNTASNEELKLKEVIVKKGASHNIPSKIEKFITVRNETASVPLLFNFRTLNCVFYLFDVTSNVGFGEKIYYGDEIYLYNWKYEKFLNRYTRKKRAMWAIR
jgi:hypothetical protein